MVSHEKAKILIANNDETSINFFLAALGEKGYQVDAARSGREALEKTLATSPDLVLVSAALPDLNGYELTERLKSDPTTAAISVILVTELGTIEDKVKGLEAGADDFLVRPFILEVLLARVRSLVKLKQLQDRLHAPAAAGHGVAGDQVKPEARPGLILLLEDDPHIAHVFSTILMTGGYQVMVAGDAAAADALLQRNVPNLVVLDLMLPGMNGLQWMEQLKQNIAYQDIPVIIVTAVTDMNTKVMGLNMGADDYLIKPVNTMELLARVNANIRKHHAERRLRAEMDDEFQQSVFDPLTGLYNRRYLESLMVRDAALSRQKGLPLTMLMLDIDHFHALGGDGGEAGELALKAVAGMLKTELRGSDLAVRYGDDTFTVTLYGINANQSLLIAERLRQKAERLTAPGIAAGQLTVSIGLGEFGPADSDLKTVLKRAEQAMRIAKDSGRNRVVA